MDIVDINKVLDDLELNEDQHSKAPKTQERIESNAPLKNDLYHSYVHGASATAPIATPMPVMPPKPNRTTKKNFVNVSNVFNSLNEYVNAGIEAVKIIEDITPQYVTPVAVNFKDSSEPTENTLTNLGSVLPTTNSSINSNNNTPAAIQNKIYNFDQPPIDLDHDMTNTVNDVCLEKPSELCETIGATEPFLNQTENNENTNENHLMIADQHSIEIESKPDEKVIATENVLPSSIEEITSNVNTKVVNDSNSSIILSNDTNTESSIVPPTSLSATLNITSTLNPGSFSDEQSEQKEIVQIEVTNVDQNEISFENVKDDSVSSYDQEQEQKLEEMEDVGNQHEECSIEIHKDLIGDDKNDQENNVNVMVASKSSERFIKPISFETAATMDDVSDTELESYLQELEDLEEMSNNQVCETSKCKNSEVAVKNEASVEKGEEMRSDITASSSQMGNIQHESNEIESDISQITSKDDRNADSFSQASTVEFGDINAESDCPTNPTFNNTTDNNERFSNLNSSETVRNANANDIKVDDCINDNIRSAEEFHTADCTNKQNNDDTENNHDTAESMPMNNLAMGGENIPAAKRPNTLELHSVIDVPKDVTPNVIAGQSSSISSTSTGDSNIMLAADSSARSEDNTHSADISKSETLPPSTPQTPTTNTPNELSNMANSSENSTLLSTSRPTPTNSANSANISINNIGKQQPYWIPDNMTLFCMQCNQKFSFIKRRHHCRACGLVLCSACCSLKAKLEYLGDVEARICIQCDMLLNKDDSQVSIKGLYILTKHSLIKCNFNQLPTQSARPNIDESADIASVINPSMPYNMEMPSPMIASRSPNPNNPMEYCSVIPPLQQVASSSTSTPISVMVPVPVQPFEYGNLFDI